MTGQAGEYLAAFVLQRSFRAIAFPNIPAPYDLIVESHAGKLLRCQVKTCDTPKIVNGNEYFRWNTRSSAGIYKEKDIDFMALVILPRRLVYFLDVKDIKGYSFYLRTDAAAELLESETLKKVLGSYINE